MAFFLSSKLIILNSRKYYDSKSSKTIFVMLSDEEDWLRYKISRSATLTLFYPFLDNVRFNSFKIIIFARNSFGFMPDVGFPGSFTIIKGIVILRKS